MTLYRAYIKSRAASVARSGTSALLTAGGIVPLMDFAAALAASRSPDFTELETKMRFICNDLHIENCALKLRVVVCCSAVESVGKAG